MRIKTALTIPIATIALCCAGGLGSAPLFAQTPAAQKAAVQGTATPGARSLPARPMANAAASAEQAPAAAPQKVDPAKEAAIRHLMDITQTAKLGDNISSAISTNVRSIMGQSLAQDRLEKFMATFEQKLRTAAPATSVENLMVPIYAQHFSTDDIQELIRFYQSPVGQRVIKVLPQVSQESQDAGLQFEHDAALNALHENVHRLPRAEVHAAER